jgi:hypothetical protein
MNKYFVFIYEKEWNEVDLDGVRYCVDKVFIEAETPKTIKELEQIAFKSFNEFRLEEGHCEYEEHELFYQVHDLDLIGSEKVK